MIFCPQPGLDTIGEAQKYFANTVSTLGVTFDHDASKSFVGTSDNLLQLCLHTGKCFGNDVYHQWVIFDDLWAGQHQDLAEMC